MRNLSKNLLFLFLSSALAGSATTIYQTGQTTVAEGTTFNVYVGVQAAYTAQGIAGFQFDLSWNPSVITLENVAEGNFLAFSTYNPFFGPGPSNDTYFYGGSGLASSGYLSGVADVTAGDSFASGGTLAAFTFQASKNATSAEIDILNASFIDYDGSLLPFNTVNPAFDFNIGTVASAPVNEPGISLPIGTGHAPTPEPSTASFLAITASFATACYALRKKLKFPWQGTSRLR